MLLVVTYSREARTTLRNLCRGHESVVVRRFGRAALLEATARGALVAWRLRERHPADVQIERTRPLRESEIPTDVRAGAEAYEREAPDHTPYARFAAGRDHPSPESLADREL